MLFKKKLGKENKEAVEQLRAKWKSERENGGLRLKVHVDQRNEIEELATHKLLFKKS